MENTRYEILQKSVWWPSRCPILTDQTRTDGHDDANSHFSQLICECTQQRNTAGTKHSCAVGMVASYVSAHLEIRWCGHSFYYE